MLAAAREDELVGCAYVRPLEPGTADLGLVSAALDQWGTGVGRELVGSAEDLVRSQGVTTMQLELLVPNGWVHPEKERLRGWYTRLGYRVDPVGARSSDGAGAPRDPARRAMRVPRLPQAARLG